MRHSEIRDIFYSYFSKKDHHKVLSSPLVPAKDPTLLFTNAGMNQFKSVFLQEEKREYKRAVSIQKCMRVSGKHNDFDEVGKSEFHHTFFEMLGNFSFGDYFKEKAIEYAWELLTVHYKFDPEKLWITVYKDDDDAFAIWEKNIGIPKNKIIRFGEKDNFWQMGETGPCGPCSEIHFDRGESFGPVEFTEDNRRYVEIWNLVFMQYFRDEQGKLNPLPAPSIDTGMGMERLTALLQGAGSNYQTDLFRPIIDFTIELAGIEPDSKNHQIDLNVIADHVKALTFLISDGVLPANDGRGYVLRRILRRAAKHGKSLGFTGTFLHKISSKAVDMMKGSYPELDYNRDFIAKVILAEEERFNHTLLNGLKRFEELLENAIQNNRKAIPGTDLFKLSDTYGFPLDFAIDLAREKDIDIDRKGFQDELTKQRERSRLSLTQKQKSIQTLKNIEKYISTFTGYDNTEEEATLLAIYKNDGETTAIGEGEEGVLVFDRTPFYAESGGQVGDTGVGRSDSIFFEITGAKKAFTGDTGAILHYVEIKKGKLEIGGQINLSVNKERRQEIEIHHSSTHLLHYALREVLGLHVKQAGSYVGPDKLRFDFTHFKALGREEIEKVETIINRKIRENNNIKQETLNYEQAIEKGAIAIFEEKYSDVVRMISMGEFSMELCGGTHLHHTGQAGFFKILSESSISSGIRRIEAAAGESAYRYVQKNLTALDNIRNYFQQKQEHIFEFLVNMDKEIKQKEKQLKKEKKESSAKIDIDSIMKNGTSIASINAITEHFEDIDRKELSALADEIKNRSRGIAVLSANINGKSAFIVSVYRDFTKQLNAGKIAKEIAKTINGNGGGRPDFAQAGGESIKDVENFKKNVTIILEKCMQG
jgi:alanyl-tRNA synthetase